MTITLVFIFAYRSFFSLVLEILSFLTVKSMSYNFAFLTPNTGTMLVSVIHDDN